MYFADLYWNMWGICNLTHLKSIMKIRVVKESGEKHFFTKSILTTNSDEKQLNL